MAPGLPSPDEVPGPYPQELLLLLLLPDVVLLLRLRLRLRLRRLLRHDGGRAHSSLHALCAQRVQGAHHGCLLQALLRKPAKTQGPGRGRHVRGPTLRDTLALHFTHSLSPTGRALSGSDSFLEGADEDQTHHPILASHNLHG